MDHTGSVPAQPSSETDAQVSKESSGSGPPSDNKATATPEENKNPGNQDDVFSDNEADEGGSTKGRQAQAEPADGGAISTSTATSNPETTHKPDQVANLARATQQVSLGSSQSTTAHTEQKNDAMSGLESSNMDSEFKVMAADASVFSFGDEEDYESE